VLSGEIDAAAATELGSQIERCVPEGAVVVDLLDVLYVDPQSFLVLLPQLLLDEVTVVGNGRLLDGLHVAHGVRLSPSLAAALA
jgi:ABC-type transporter Mla MlaB component